MMIKRHAPQENKRKSPFKPWLTAFAWLATLACLSFLTQPASMVAKAQETKAATPKKASETKRKNRYSKQVEGPELPGFITRPGTKSDAAPSNEPNTEDIGANLAFGAYQKGYYLTALNLALPRAESGDPAAQTLIAELYWKGLGVGRDKQEAIRWYEFAAEAGNREAQFAYGNILLRDDTIKNHKTKGEVFLRKAAEQGHARAAFNIAQMMTARRPTWASFKRALPFYQKAADANIADAQYALANIHAEAKGVNFNNDEIARKWLSRSAKNGLDTAQVDFGIWLANGRGGKKDEKEARLWFIKAASQGNRIAQNRLARLYAYGIGVKVDKIRGSAWHILSRRAGFSDSQMDELFNSLSKIDQKRALEAANQLTSRVGS